MRARYKLGTFVQYVTQRDAEESPSSGLIEAVVTRKEGHTYIVNTWKEEIHETCILAAFREMKPRAVAQKRTKTATSKKSKKAEETNSAHT